MTSSLLLAATDELLPDDPTAVGLHVLLDYDLGDPQTVTAAVEALLLDGERVHRTRVGNRTFTLPVIVRGSSRADLTARVDALLTTVGEATYTLTWTPDIDDPLPLIFDCFPAQATVLWDVRIENVAYAQQVDLVIPALPYGRSDDTLTPTLTLALETTGARVWTISDLIGSARSPVGVQIDFPDFIDAWLLHRPPTEADPAAPIVTDITDGEAAIGDAELLRGTYSVVLGVGTYGAPGENREVEVTFSQDDTDATQTLIKSYVSGLNLHPLVVGNITLPLVDRPAGSAIDLTVNVDDSGDSTFYTVMLLDTRGQTVQSLSQAFGTSLAASVWIDPPDIGAAVGPLWSSATGDRADAYAVAEPRISGGPILLSQADEGGALLGFSAGSIPDEPVLGYYPRWLAERVE